MLSGVHHAGRLRLGTPDEAVLHVMAIQPLRSGDSLNSGHGPRQPVPKGW